MPTNCRRRGDDTARRFREDDRRGNKHFRFRAGIIRGISRFFRQRNVAGCGDEALEIGVRDRISIYPETVHRYTMDRRFFPVVTIGTHEKGSTLYPDHTCTSCPSVRTADVDMEVISLGGPSVSRLV